MKLFLVIVLVHGGLGGCSLSVKPRDGALYQEGRAPLFSLPDHNGNHVDLQQLLSKGPVMIVFYRGHW